MIFLLVVLVVELIQVFSFLFYYFFFFIVMIGCTILRAVSGILRTQCGRRGNGPREATYTASSRPCGSALSHLVGVGGQPLAMGRGRSAWGARYRARSNQAPASLPSPSACSGRRDWAGKDCGWLSARRVLYLTRPPLWLYYRPGGSLLAPVAHLLAPVAHLPPSWLFNAPRRPCGSTLCPGGSTLPHLAGVGGQPLAMGHGRSAWGARYRARSNQAPASLPPLSACSGRRDWAGKDCGWLPARRVLSLTWPASAVSH